MSHELVGVVIETDGDTAKVGLRNRLDAGDTVEYLSPGIEERNYRIESMKDIEGSDIASARNEDIVIIRVPGEVRGRDLIRRKKNFRVFMQEGIRSGLYPE